MPLTSTTAAERKRGDDHSLLIQRHLPRLGYCTLLSRSSIFFPFLSFSFLSFPSPIFIPLQALPSDVTAQSVPPSSTIILPTPKPNSQNHTPSSPALVTATPSHPHHYTPPRACDPPTGVQNSSPAPPVPALPGLYSSASAPRPRHLHLHSRPQAAGNTRD